MQVDKQSQTVPRDRAVEQTGQRVMIGAMHEFQPRRHLCSRQGAAIDWLASGCQFGDQAIAGPHMVAGWRRTNIAGEHGPVERCFRPVDIEIGPRHTVDHRRDAGHDQIWQQAVDAEIFQSAQRLDRV